MSDKEILFSNIDKIHTTTLGINRIKSNLKVVDDVIEFLKNKILSNNSTIYKKGKNYYCIVDNMIITINSYNYCIITAHILK